MTIGIMDQIEEWFNVFPSTDSILDTVGPSNILEGKSIHDCNKARVPFGAYVMTYICTTNTMDHRLVHAITLNITNNFGGCYYFSLETGKRFHSKKWTRLPIRDKIISEVNDWGE